MISFYSIVGKNKICPVRYIDFRSATVQFRTIKILRNIQFPAGLFDIISREAIDMGPGGSIACRMELLFLVKRCMENFLQVKSRDSRFCISIVVIWWSDISVQHKSRFFASHNTTKPSCLRVVTLSIYDLAYALNLRFMTVFESTVCIQFIHSYVNSQFPNWGIILLLFYLPASLS